MEAREAVVGIHPGNGGLNLSGTGGIKIER